MQALDGKDRGNNNCNNKGEMRGFFAALRMTALECYWRLGCVALPAFDVGWDAYCYGGWGDGFGGEAHGS
jgi:hypothetical protein